MENMLNLSDLGEKMLSSSIVVFKGQLLNIDMIKNKNSEVCYVADLKSIRISGDSGYSSYDIRRVCFGSDIVSSRSLSQDDMKSLKNNEVLLLISENCTIKTGSRKDGTKFKYNWVNYFVDDFVLLRQLDKPSSIKQLNDVIRL